MKHTNLFKKIFQNIPTRIKSGIYDTVCFKIFIAALKTEENTLKYPKRIKSGIYDTALKTEENTLKYPKRIKNSIYDAFI